MQEWQRSYQEASTSVGDRDARVAAVAEALESGLQLVGATAVEDRLQEGAPAAIASMMAAGLRVRRPSWAAPPLPLRPARCTVCCSQSNICPL